MECKTFSVPAQSLDITQENVFLGQTPTCIVIGCVDNDAFNERLIKNSFNSKHYNSNKKTVQVDGQEQPMKLIQCNFDKRKIVQTYMSLFQGTGKVHEDEDIDVAREEYVGGYTVFCFDVTPDLDECGHIDLIKTGSIRLGITLGTPLAQTIKVIVNAEFQNILEVDKNCNVFYDYTA